MRILIISDVHANPWALHAAARDAGPIDYIVSAGDTVSYGPDSRSTVAWLRERGVLAARGNHDHAVAFGADPKASSAKQPLALAMPDWTRSQLEPADIGWLARLPLHLTWEVGGVRFAVVHATPRDPLYDYQLQPDASETVLDEITAEIHADVLVVGHTHCPLLRRRGNLQIVNPGSVGQPLDGDPRAAYAVWENGKIALRRAAYDPSAALAAIGRLPIHPSLREALADTLRFGRLQ